MRPAGLATAAIRAVDRDGAVLITGPAAVAGFAPGDSVSVGPGPRDALVVTGGGPGRIDARGRLRLPVWWRRRHLRPDSTAGVVVAADRPRQLVIVSAGALAPLILTGPAVTPAGSVPVNSIDRYLVRTGEAPPTNVGVAKATDRPPETSDRRVPAEA